MDYNPDEAVERESVEPGWHVLQVVEAEERASTAGNPMIVVELTPAGMANGPVIREFLVATAAALWKVKQFCQACGLQDKFSTGRLTEQDLRGRRVRAELDHEHVDGFDRPFLRVKQYDLDDVPQQPPPRQPGFRPMPEEQPAARREALGVDVGHRAPEDDDIPF